MFNFDKDVHIVNWVDGSLIAILSPLVGLTMMARSNRFDVSHAVANVRTLHPEDACQLHISPKTAIRFEQE